MDDKTLMKVLEEFKRNVDSMTRAEMEAETQRAIRQAEMMMALADVHRVLAEVGLEPVAVDVLPDDEAQDDEGEHAENLQDDHEDTTFRGQCTT